MKNGLHLQMSAFTRKENRPPIYNEKRLALRVRGVSFRHK